MKYASMGRSGVLRMHAAAGYDASYSDTSGPSGSMPAAMMPHTDASYSIPLVNFM